MPIDRGIEIQLTATDDRCRVINRECGVVGQDDRIVELHSAVSGDVSIDTGRPRTVGDEAC